MYGGINWLKKQIAGVGGEVAKCVSATNVKRHLCRENLEAAKMMKVDKKWTDNEARQEIQIS